MSGKIRYGAASAVESRSPSPIIWDDCPVAEIQANPAKGSHWFDDFKNSVVQTSNTTTTDFTSGVGEICGDINWYVYQETSKIADVVLQQDNDGVLLIQSDGTDADVGAITTGMNVGGVLKTPTEGTPPSGPKKIWFECRIKTVSVTANDGGFFVGIAQPGEAKDAGGAMAAGGASLSDVDHIGFASLSGAMTALKYAYNEATAGTATTGSAATIAAATWYRVGFKVANNGSGWKLRWYVNGVDLGDSAAIDISSSNANFPGATDMDLLLAYVAESGAADADGLYIDWVRAAEEY